MDAEQIIAEIKRLEYIFALPDTTPLSPEGPLDGQSEAQRNERA